ncbi:hypothetical protein, partial [Duganella sp. Root1480D1]|uniref:hypothetical protein n=1 Tax=Duganella sp. Root1480D1 TaxID=1736471 RepID=UPI000A9BFA0D
AANAKRVVPAEITYDLGSISNSSTALDSSSLLNGFGSSNTIVYRDAKTGAALLREGPSGIDSAAIGAKSATPSAGSLSNVSGDLNEASNAARSQPYGMGMGTPAPAGPNIIDISASNGASTALGELGKLPNLAGKTSAEIESALRAQGYTSVSANNGGTVWTKNLPDGNTAAVRIDPATVRVNPKGFADEVPHAHKEIVPTANVVNGNYKPGKSVITLDDSCCATKNPSDTHIPIK